MNNSTEVKRKQWDTYREEFVDKATDKLGKSIDHEIRELVVGLNILGFRTTMSCIGRIRENETLAIKEFILTPYVFIKPVIKKEFEEKLEDLRQKVSTAKKTDNKEAYKKAYKEWVSFKDKVSNPYYDCIIQLTDLFAEFYKNRQVAYDAQIMVSGSLQRVIVRNLGEDYLYLANLDTKKAKLKEYQDEFIAFGEFLKAKYFGKTYDI